MYFIYSSSYLWSHIIHIVCTSMSKVALGINSFWKKNNLRFATYTYNCTGEYMSVRWYIYKKNKMEYRKDDSFFFFFEMEKMIVKYVVGRASCKLSSWSRVGEKTWILFPWTLSLSLSLRCNFDSFHLYFIFQSNIIKILVEWILIPTHSNHYDLWELGSYSSIMDKGMNTDKHKNI